MVFLYANDLYTTNIIITVQTDLNIIYRPFVVLWKVDVRNYCIAQAVS